MSQSSWAGAGSRVPTRATKISSSDGTRLSTTWAPQALGEVLDPGAGIELEALAQLLGVVLIPAGEEGPRVAHQLPHGHPARQIVLLGEITEVGQHARRIADGIPAKDAHRAALGL